MSKKLKNYASQDERKRAGDLIRGATSSLFSIFKLRVSKRESRVEENKRQKNSLEKTESTPENTQTCAISVDT